MAASEIIADRTCIGNYGKTSSSWDQRHPAVGFSALQLISCCSYCAPTPCGGGWPLDAMKYWEMTGVVTGAPYNSKCGCLPYQGFSGNTSTVPRCSQSCIPGYPRSFSADKNKASMYYSIKGEANMMTEIMENGPIECAFVVYENFLHYKGGIYNATGGDKHENGHAVKIIGWGEENGTKYWLTNNSWSTAWGMKGQFKFLRGTDFCGMESHCVAGMAKTNNNVDFSLSCQ